MKSGTHYLLGFHREVALNSYSSSRPRFQLLQDLPESHCSVTGSSLVREVAHCMFR